MSLLPKESIKVIAEMNCINLSDEVAHALAPDVEYRIREITQARGECWGSIAIFFAYRHSPPVSSLNAPSLLQEALKFMRHAKRCENSYRVQSARAGVVPDRPNATVRYILTNDDVNHALSVRNLEALYVAASAIADSSAASPSTLAHACARAVDFWRTARSLGALLRLRQLRLLLSRASAVQALPAGARLFLPRRCHPPSSSTSACVLWSTRTRSLYS